MRAGAQHRAPAFDGSLRAAAPRARPFLIERTSLGASRCVWVGGGGVREEAHPAMARPSSRRSPAAYGMQQPTVQSEQCSVIAARSRAILYCTVCRPVATACTWQPVGAVGACAPTLASAPRATMRRVQRERGQHPAAPATLLPRQPLEATTWSPQVCWCSHLQRGSCFLPAVRLLCLNRASPRGWFQPEGSAKLVARAPASLAQLPPTTVALL